MQECDVVVTRKQILACERKKFLPGTVLNCSKTELILLCDNEFSPLKVIKGLIVQILNFIASIKIKMTLP